MTFSLVSSTTDSREYEWVFLFLDIEARNVRRKDKPNRIGKCVVCLAQRV